MIQDDARRVSAETTMHIDPQLIDILRCPKCKGELELEEEQKGFICHGCRLRYPVVDGIPNFLVAEAEPVEGR